MYSLKKALAASLVRRSLKGGALPLHELERKHSDPEELHFNDSSYFVGRGEDGASLVVRLAFRAQKGAEYWLKCYLPGRGSFELRDLEATEGEGFTLGPLSFSCLEPGRRWAIRYTGPVYRGTQTQQLELDLVFTATRPLVNFKHITDPDETAEAIARESWDRVFFKSLKEISKMHLEQGGTLQGNLVLDGERIPVRWRSVRDHSWGKRSWKTWKRHVWLAGMLDNGEAFNLSMISYEFMGQISAGYLSSGEELYYFSRLPAMDAFAGSPLIPERTGFNFTSGDGTRHTISIRSPWYFDFMMDGAYFIREGMAEFNLDGIPGLGVAEFGLNPKCYDTPTG